MRTADKLPSLRANCLEIRETQPAETPSACTGTALTLCRTITKSVKALQEFIMECWQLNKVKINLGCILN